MLPWHHPRNGRRQGALGIPPGSGSPGPANHPDLLGRRDKLYISDVSYFLGFKDQGSFGGPVQMAAAADYTDASVP